MMNLLENKYIKAQVAATLAVLSLFLLAQTMLTFRQYKFVGVGVGATNTISVSGKGEVFAVPDIATFTVTVKEESKKQSEAQKAASEKINKIIAFLKSEGIEEKDIKTVSYSLSPRYDWLEGGREFRGYELRQSLKVKIRDTEKAGKILARMSEFGADYVSGLNFEIDDDEKLKNQARKKAIEDAKSKAKDLARQLGVDLVRIVGFSEMQGGNVYPVRFEKAVAFDAVEGSAGVPELPLGENKISVQVDIVYEVR